MNRIIQKMKVVINGKVVVDAEGEDAARAAAEIERARLEELYKITHPEEHRGLSGCCDSAENYPT